MSANSPAVPESTHPARGADSLLRIESQAIYLALIFGGVGAVVGFLLSRTAPYPPLAGSGSFGFTAASLAAAVAALVAGVGYWRTRNRPGQEWRLELATWTTVVNTVAVVVIHAALAFLGTYAAYLLLSEALVGLPVRAFLGAVLMALTLGLTVYLVFPSVARMTTQRTATLLMAFVFLGTLTSAVTTSDPQWWEVHFSQLGTFGDVSSWIFNGTLIAGGLLVTTFAVYISHDMHVLVTDGRLLDSSSPRTVSVLFVVMGAMLAGVGLAPVDTSFWIHTLCASGMAVVYMMLLIGGRKYLGGMPPTYFLASWLFLAAIAVTIVLFLTTFFSLAALEITVFALIFGWITVFIRFLGLAGDDN